MSQIWLDCERLVLVVLPTQQCSLLENYVLIRLCLDIQDRLHVPDKMISSPGRPPTQPFFE
eukprot:10641695-Karenia_brevis.AAC.1